MFLESDGRRRSDAADKPIVATVIRAAGNHPTRCAGGAGELAAVNQAIERLHGDSVV